MFNSRQEEVKTENTLVHHSTVTCEEDREETTGGRFLFCFFFNFVYFFVKHLLCTFFCITSNSNCITLAYKMSVQQYLSWKVYLPWILMKLPHASAFISMLSVHFLFENFHALFHFASSFLHLIQLWPVALFVHLMLSIPSNPMNSNRLYLPCFTDLVMSATFRWNSCIKFLSCVAHQQKNIGKSQSCLMLQYLSLNNRTKGE